MRRLRARHPNRAGLRVVDGPDTDRCTTSRGIETQRADALPACRCPTSTVAGTRWAYDRQLGWHDPDEHGDWRPPYWPNP